MKYCKACDVCLMFRNKSMVHDPLHPIPPLPEHLKMNN